MNFGFSYIGLIFIAMLLIPNIIWTKHKPEGYDEYSKNENKVLLILERIGEVLVMTLLLIFKDCNIRPHSLWIGWLILTFVLMAMYEWRICTPHLQASPLRVHRSQFSLLCHLVYMQAIYLSS